MFSRFTASARRVMQRAFREAKRCQHDFVGTEHLLYGLCYDADGPAVTLLRTLGGRPELLLEKVELSLQRHDGGMAMEKFPLSPASKRAFRAAADEVSSFHHQMIGPEHLLLGLLREQDSEAAQLLAAHNVTFAMVRDAVARIPADAYHESQVRAQEPVRFHQTDNPTADELERWIAPPITVNQEMQTNAQVQLAVMTQALTMPQSVEAQLRRTQYFLGAFAGYTVGHWLGGRWYLGLLLAIVGLILAYFNRLWLSVIMCSGAALFAVEIRHRMAFDQLQPMRYALAAPLGALFGTFLSDFWRFMWLPQLPQDDKPIEPSGIPVQPDTPLEAGSVVFIESHGRWWRGVVISLEGPDEVRVRYPGMQGQWEEYVPRGELQLPPR